MDQDIAPPPPQKNSKELNPWPNSDVPSRGRIDFARPLNGAYYSIVADSFSIWP